MRFDVLDRRMRVYETRSDLCVLPGLWMVARLDGRGFTRLTGDAAHGFPAPYDERFRDLMVETIRHLMAGCGFDFLYAHTHSDELSLLFRREDDAFGRKLRKLCSVLAGEASAAFSVRLGAAAAFDARISQLPADDLVVDYFRWRQEDAGRNALSAHCYWLLRTQGQSAAQATAQLAGCSVAAKNELLFAHGVSFNEVPAWHKRGVALFWTTYEKIGCDPRTGAQTSAERRRLHTELELPFGEGYAAWLRGLLGLAGG